MRILITGNLGYIGPVVVEHLREVYPQAELIGLDTGYFAGCLTDVVQLPEIALDQQLYLDVRDVTVETLRGVDGIIHLAAISNDPMGKAFEAMTEEINARATLRLAEIAKEAGVRAFAFASSCSVYGFSENGICNEDSPVNPLTAYARSKVDSEIGLHKIADADFHVVCLRFSTACGASPRLRLDLVLNDFCAAATVSGEIQILSDGTPWRPLIDTRDMARAFEWAIEYCFTANDPFVVLNVGSDEWVYQIKELAYAVQQIIPEAKVSINPNAQPDKRSYRVDFSRFRALAPNHQPQATLAGTARELVESLRRIPGLTADFRTSRLARLAVLQELRAEGMLDELLYWSDSVRSSGLPVSGAGLRSLIEREYVPSEQDEESPSDFEAQNIRGQLRRLEAEHTHSQSELSMLRETLDVQRTEIARLTRDLADRDTRIAHLSHNLRGILSSWSWWVSSPIRAGGQIVRAFRSTSSAAQLGRSIWRTATGGGNAGAETQEVVDRIRASGLFDESYYMANNPDVFAVSAVELDPITHYVTAGAHEQRDPNPLFSTSYYIQTHPDVAAAGKNPLDHYISTGASQGRNPSPLFHTAFYSSQASLNGKSGGTSEQVNPLRHFLEEGGARGLKPNPFFDSVFYLKENPEVARAGINPLIHYCQSGWRDGKNPSPHFDTLYYLQHYHDIAMAKVNPLEHYLMVGAGEGRQPREQAYKEWLATNETFDLDAATAQLRTFRELPTFSILIPVYNTPEKILRACIDSVRNQLYPHFELCLADDASTLPHVKKILEEYSAKDPRIKVTYRTKNGHIAVATNSALELATGEYVCFMDHDDEIAPNALFEFAALIERSPELDFIYSDEDKITVDGERYEPFLKPDWSPEYLESCMYTAHFACYRTRIAREIGGLRSGYHGAQDYDFVLRFTEQTEKIAHVPKILYHWRAIPGSTALAMDSKDYVIDAAVRALEDRLERKGRPGKVKPNHYKGCFDVRSNIVGKPLVSIVIPSAGKSYVINGRKVDVLAHCIESIHKKSSYKNFEIIVVDNNDLTESTLRKLAKYKIRYVHYTEPFNISKKMNLGAAEAKGEYLLLLNDDIEVINRDWIEAMLSVAQEPGVGVVGAKLYFADGTLQHVGVTFCDGLPDHIYRGFPGKHPGYFFSSVAQRNYMGVTGAVMLTPRSLYKQLGGFEEALAVNYNDIDFCLKAYQLGYRVVYAPQAELFHYESLNRERTVAENEINLFLDRWQKFVEHDPYYRKEFSAKPPNFVLTAPEKKEPITDESRSSLAQEVANLGTGRFVGYQG